jgi:hypothetical protein
VYKISQVYHTSYVSIRHADLVTGREISAEVAQRTDELNEFPAEMWQKMGDAGYEISQLLIGPIP